MKFKNESKVDVKFSLLGDGEWVHVECKAGGTCEVPAELASAIPGQAPQLKPVGDDSPAAKAAAVEATKGK